MAMQLALRIVVHPTELQTNHGVRILVLAEDGDRVAELGLDFEMDPTSSNLLPGEEAALPLAIPLSNVGIPQEGRYSIEVLIDDVHQISVPFSAVIVSGETT